MMSYSLNMRSAAMAVLILFFWSLGPAKALAAFSCSSDELPAFLAEGVDPNLLLMIDNSGSMYDLAYASQGYCYDDSYDPAASYMGYFDPETWYHYDLVGNRFEATTPADAAVTCSAATGNKYASSTTSNDICITVNEGVSPHAVTALAARGNLFNWALASKLDVQKKVLTGGKFDSANQQLVMEARGCVGRRLVKDIPLDNTKYLTLGVRAPEFAEKANGTDDTTRIDVFAIGTKFADSACQDAINEFKEASPNQGQISQDLQDCMGYTPGGSSQEEANSNAAFNHALHVCWYRAKSVDGSWPNGSGSVTSMKNACEDVYADLALAGDMPNSIRPADTAYACYGVYGADPVLGYIGRCWEPTGGSLNCADRACTTEPVSGANPRCNSGTVEICSGNYNASQDKCSGNPGTWVVVQDCTGGGDIEVTGWTNDQDFDYDGISNEVDDDFTGNGTVDSDDCVDKALRDYCGTIDMPEVIDPTDVASRTDDFWNLPAVLIDSGVVAQKGEPITTLLGQVYQAADPTGIIKEYEDTLRLGAMVFNDNGSAEECAANPKIECTDPAGANLDGSRMVAYVDQGAAHTASLVAAINDIKATTWTPLAETMYNALGYYTQKSALRLNGAGDFLMDADADAYAAWQNNTAYAAGAIVKSADGKLFFTVAGGTSNATDDDGDGTLTLAEDGGVAWTPFDPVTNWCQHNNILLITEGASTADQHADISSFLATASPDDNDGDGFCGELSGSTYFDDLTNYAWNGSNIYETELSAEADKAKKNVKTYILGILRDDGNADECNPKTLMENAAINGGTTLYAANNPGELENKMREAFESIRAGAAAGSAASVISSSRSGEGAVYQAIFWPKYTGPNNVKVTWVGEVHALFVDAFGKLFEDTNHNRTLDATDKHVVIYYDQAEEKSMACYGDLDATMDCVGTSKELNEVNYLWSARDWLAGISSANIDDQRSAADYIYDPTSPTPRQRYIFTWNDLDNNGIVDSATEILDFEDEVAWEDLAIPPGANRGAAVSDFNVLTDAEADEIVNWIRGMEVAGMRSRLVDYDGDNLDEMWRLGDVIHSTPILVSNPAEAYHFLYNNDAASDYGLFARKYDNRRQVIYFGGNDGMFHAVNGGFFDAGANKFCRQADCNEDPLHGPIETEAPELGTELWAYVPYNLLPHLKCLSDPGYGSGTTALPHNYFVDQIPRVFDVQIFDEEVACNADYMDPDCIHPGGWGTILVGSMRFGGTPVAAFDLNGDSDDKRVFTSAYFVMDITNPEEPPVLLGEMTTTSDNSCVEGTACAQMGYTTPMPTMVPIVADAGVAGNMNDVSEWNLILGSGPTNQSGSSTQPGMVAMFPLKYLTGVSKKPFRIPNSNPSITSLDRGVYALPDAASFVSDLITVDYDRNFIADSIYFGTVSGSLNNWQGKLYRLKNFEDSNLDGQQEVSYPADWDLLPLIDVGQPVTAAPAVGTDGYNYWVYFGTGRFFDKDEKADASRQSFYGIKEPMTCSGTAQQSVYDFTWDEVVNIPTDNARHNGTPGSQGLLQVDQIQVEGAATSALSDLSCLDDLTNACLPDDPDDPGQKILTFDKLTNYIVGNRCPVPDPFAIPDVVTVKTGTDGWYRDFLSARERNVGQATLLGGLVTFTTYQPNEDTCLSEGLAYLYGLYYQTGTAWHRSVFGDTVCGQEVTYRMSLGRGMATTPNLHVGKQQGSKAFVQTSTGAIVGVNQPNLPYASYKTGRASWLEIGP